MASSKHGEIIEVNEGGVTKKFRILERPVDIQTNCIKRELVPVDTDEDDIPIGSRLLDERETDGHLARSAKPDIINVGDAVRRKFPQGYIPTVTEAMPGTVEAKLKGDRFRVRWENGANDRLGAGELARIW